MKITRLPEDKIDEYERLGCKVTHRIEDGKGYSIEVDDRTAAWIARAIAFGRAEAKSELRFWLNTDWAKVK